MSSYDRRSGSGISSLCAYTASPPIRRNGTPASCAASRMRSASTTISAFDTLHQLDSGVADVDEVPAQDAVVRLAPRVHGQGRPDLALAARLVDVAVNRKQGLALLDQPPHGRRAD